MRATIPPAPFRPANHSIPAFRRRPATRGGEFRAEPVFEIRGAKARLNYSDGVANHGNHTVGIFRRSNGFLARWSVKYGPEPVTVIEDPGLRYPHSVAFTPGTHHLVVSNAGANYLGVYRPRQDGSGLQWSQLPVARKIIGSEKHFEAINARNKMEGGPKGIAIQGNSLAVCSPEHGIRIYAFREAAPRH